MKHPINHYFFITYAILCDKFLVLYQLDIAVFSELVSVHGKACLAGNSTFYCQKAQRSPWALTSSPTGRYRDTLQSRYTA